MRVLRPRALLGRLSATRCGQLSQARGLLLLERVVLPKKRLSYMSLLQVLERRLSHKFYFDSCTLLDRSSTVEGSGLYVSSADLVPFGRSHATPRRRRRLLHDSFRIQAMTQSTLGKMVSQWPG